MGKQQSQIAPYGSWASPISAEQAAGGIRRPGQIAVSEGVIYWSESRPREGGRIALMRLAKGEPATEVTPPTFNCRTRVHEYGGGAFLVDGSSVYACSFEDQRMYHLKPEADPVPITPEPQVPAGLRYADGRLTSDRRLIVCVREVHDPDGSVQNQLVALPPSGASEPQVIASGRDFYAFPRPSPDGRQLAWIEWDQPNMPWDGTELWLADLAADGTLSNQRLLAGGAEESIFQPEWSPSGELHLVSDRSGWWNLYRWREGQVEPLAERAAEFGSPMWVFGLSRYTFTPDGRLLCIFSQDGVDSLAVLTEDGFQPLETEFTSFYPVSLHFDAEAGRAVFVAGNSQTPAGVYALEIERGELMRLTPPPAELPPAQYVSSAQSISFPTAGGRTAHALYYPPTNPDFQAPRTDRPPLLVVSHGGPTSEAHPIFDLPLQFFTSRGFAVVDVNYRGSTGYGREYRRMLNGEWGVADVEDCIAAARYLVDQGQVDPDRLVIRGGSAGGYTTLCALVFHDFFSAGANYYGVADAETLAKHTHKFEARYLDSMLGPYPEAAELYRQRSPIHFVDQCSAPVVVLQGGEDKVVPPEQSEQLVEALAAKGLPYAYLLFPDEAHGFRKAENMQRGIEAELYFFSRIFGFELAEPVEPITIHNLENWQN